MFHIKDLYKVDCHYLVHQLIISDIGTHFILFFKSRLKHYAVVIQDLADVFIQPLKAIYPVWTYSQPKCTVHYPGH